jgi:hypothetical protein
LEIIDRYPLRVKPDYRRMIVKRLLLSLISVISVLTLLTLGSCEKFEGDQTIPSYIHIDSIHLTTDYSTQGTASHSITDAWVYVDDDLIGTFPLPATFPVLKEGKHQVTVYAGIKKNGIATTRTAYPYYKPMVKTINLVPDSIVSLGNMGTTYTETTEFLWREDFENIAISLDTTTRSMVPITLTPIGSPLTFEGAHSGRVDLDTANNFFECETHNQFNIPAAPVYLELNFNTTNRLTIGVYIYSDVYLYEVPIITLFSTNGKWKKIYIDLTTTLNSYYGSYTFKVYMGTYKEPGNDPTQILLDNFKLVTRSSKK